MNRDSGIGTLLSKLKYMLMKDIKKKEVLKSKSRKWEETTHFYDKIWIIPAGTKHDSGYMHIAIVGVWTENKKEKYEICGFCDDLSTYFPMIQLSEGHEYPNVRMDCLYPSGILQYHGHGKFWVSASLSSMDIKFYPEKSNGRFSSILPQ